MQVWVFFFLLLFFFALVGSVGDTLSGLYCAMPRDYLSDTPLLRAMGFLASQHGQLGAIHPPPFLSDSPLGEHAKWRCDTPPQKGYLSDTGAIPYENKANGVRYPPLRYYLERVLRGRGGGGVSRTGPPSGTLFPMRSSCIVATQWILKTLKLRVGSIRTTWLYGP